MTLDSRRATRLAWRAASRQVAAYYKAHCKRNINWPPADAADAATGGCNRNANALAALIPRKDKQHLARRAHQRPLPLARLRAP